MTDPRHVVVPISRTAMPKLQAPVQLVAESCAAMIATAMRDANTNDLLDILAKSAPPPKQTRRRLGRKAILTGYADIRSELYLARERELRQIARYQVRARLPAVLVAHYLIFSRDAAPDRVFHNGLLSTYALSSIVSAATVKGTGTPIIPTVAASRQKEELAMTHKSPTSATPKLIFGVNAAVVEAEPDVIVAFEKYRDEAVRGAHLETDRTDEISRLISKGERILASLER